VYTRGNLGLLCNDCNGCKRNIAAPIFNLPLKCVLPISLGKARRWPFWPRQRRLISNAYDAHTGFLTPCSSSLEPNVCGEPTAMNRLARLANDNKPNVEQKLAGIVERQCPQKKDEISSQHCGARLLRAYGRLRSVIECQ